MIFRESAGVPHVLGFHDKATGSAQYLVWDPATKAAAVIDVVQEFDPASGFASHDAAAWVLEQVAARGLRLDWILDTHPHADHFSAAAWLRDRTGVPVGIGEKVRDVADLWAGIYGQDFDPARHFDRLFTDGDTFLLGDLPVRVMLHPGHTAASVTYVIGDAAFVHDTLMQPGSGTSRADFPGGSADVLYDSLQSILSLPDATRLFVGHDYSDDPQWESTVAIQKAQNKHVGGGVSRADFVALRDARDKTLPLPDRMLHALQVNLRGGRLPDPDAEGRRFFRIPANVFRPVAN